MKGHMTVWQLSEGNGSGLNAAQAKAETPGGCNTIS